MDWTLFTSIRPFAKILRYKPSFRFQKRIYFVSSIPSPKSPDLIPSLSQEMILKTLSRVIALIVILHQRVNRTTSAGVVRLSAVDGIRTDVYFNAKYWVHSINLQRFKQTTYVTARNSTDIIMIFPSNTDAAYKCRCPIKFI
jgi:hypothetical protein